MTNKQRLHLIKWLEDIRIGIAVSESPMGLITKINLVIDKLKPTLDIDGIAARTIKVKEALSRKVIDQDYKVTYDSISDCARSLGVSRPMIYKNPDRFTII